MSGTSPRILDNRYALEVSSRLGGMAEVFPATDMQENGTRVAVKMFRGVDQKLASKVFDSEYRALDKLRHKNIVRLLDAGRDEVTGKRYLVFDWVDDDLEHRRRNGMTPTGWDDFVRDLGAPLFSALAAAHGEGIAHRDIKPANILIDKDGVPKLADFGIAKIIADIAPGMTTAGFGSEPFAAPAAIGVDRHTAGDVYSLGVTVLSLLTTIDPYQDRYEENPRLFVEEALSTVDAPSEALAFLVRCTALELADRPRNGGVAMAELEALSFRRDEAAAKLGFKAAPVCYLSLSAKARESLMVDFGLGTEEEADTYLLRDLSEGVSLLPVPRQPDGERVPPSAVFFLLGSELRCRIEPMTGAPRFRVHSVRPESGALLDRDRGRGWSGVLGFSLDPPNNKEAAERDFSAVMDVVLEVDAERNRLARGQREQQVLGVWRRSLQALAEIERDREKPISYSDLEVKKNRVLFRVKGDLANHDLIGQQRIAELLDGSLFVGQVTQASGRDLVLRVEQGNAAQLPRRGKLKVDMRLGQVALRRQESTLDALQRGAVARPKLEQILLEPSTASAAEPVPEPQWIQEKLDQPKRKAVMTALGSSDMVLVEGPPGTGKTTMIVELIVQELRRNPETRILLSSQTHSALDNVLERLRDLEIEQSPRLLRVGRPGDERIAADVEQLLIAPQLREWRGDVIKDGRKFLRDWARERAISERGVEIAMRLDELASVLESAETTAEKLDMAKDRLQELRDTRRSGRDTSNETVSDAQDRIAVLQLETVNLEQLRTDLVERLSALDSDFGGGDSLSTEDLRERATAVVDRSHPDYERCSQLVRLLGDWHARFGRGAEFETAALVRAQVVAGTCVGLASVPGWENIEFDLCIVDEASKANPTEILIPMARANRWVLVGDHRQLPPHLDEALLDKELLNRFELSGEDLEETLFERMRRELATVSQVTLSEQHRMAPAIGDLISHCFYGGELGSAPKQHPDWLSMVLPTPVMWISTSQSRSRSEERAGFGRTNPHEARCIRDFLGSLNLVAAAAKQKVSVAILSGYREQCEEISRQIAEKVPDWPALEIESNTVDAFQGREADVAIYSVTRSNMDGNIGFLAERRRLNVALSRGRFGLVIVGDDRFAYSATGENPFRDVLDFIEDSDGCSMREAEL